MLHIQELIEKLAAAVIVVDPSDLSALAKIHEDLTLVPTEIAKDGAVGLAAREHAEQAATQAARLVEGILLRDISDTAAALVSVSEQIAQLQEIITGAEIPAVSKLKQSPAFDKRAAGKATPSTPATPNDILDADAPLRPEDLPLITEFIAEADSHLESAEAALLELGSDVRRLRNAAGRHQVRRCRLRSSYRRSCPHHA
jgi:hypothetical protein